MDGNDVMVSVIVLTYNHEKYIRQALDSILMQKVDFKYEILVGDDASTDGTPEILREYTERYSDKIRPFFHEKNIGATRNAYDLLACARGKYLATLEGDDFWCNQTKLQSQVDFLESHSKYIGCSHTVRIVDMQGNRVLSNPDWISKKQVFSLCDFDGIHLPGQPSSLVRRNIFREPTHDYSVVTADPLIGDRTLALVFLLQGDFYRLPQEMSAYRYNPDNIGENLTSRIYSNDLSIERDFEITCRLEQYAAQEFGQILEFKHFKHELYAKASFKAVFKRSKRLWSLAKRIRGNRLSYIFAMPFCCIGFALKYIKKIINRRG